ncbi:hypothetical protein BH20ACT20_BH20ACT20_11600 [soil metagenome]
MFVRGLVSVLLAVLVAVTTAAAPDADVAKGTRVSASPS